MITSLQMNPVAAHKWEKRVLIFSASSPTSIGYKRQEQLLTKGKKGMKERDLIIYKLYDDHWVDPMGMPLTEEQALAIRQDYDLPEGHFMVVLIGKDGEIKLRKTDIVEPREVFALIDSMPMRQQEMKAKQSDKKGVN